MKRDFSKFKRVVIKIGTNVLTKDGSIDFAYIENIAGQIASVKNSAGIKPLIVSSGAIGIGAHELGIDRKIKKTRTKQACAAVGQPLLLHRYRLGFQQFNIPIAQVLLTKEALDNRDTYVNLQNSVEKLLELGVVPIFNENDCISTSEIAPFIGDNDQLSAHIASKLDMDLQLILSDIDALYDKNPAEFADAKPISVVEELTHEIYESAGGASSEFSTGGMKTKLKAVSIAQKAGCSTILAHGRESRIIPRILEGEDIGTLFVAKERLKNRTRWILQSTPKGKLIIDEGAIKALEGRKSLLPSGLVSVEGEFAKGDVIMIGDRFKAVAGSCSTDMRKIIGVHSSKIHDILGDAKRDVISRSGDIVFIEKNPEEE